MPQFIKPTEFGIVQDQTRLVATKAAEEKSGLHVRFGWLYAVLFICIIFAILCCINGIKTPAEKAVSAQFQIDHPEADVTRPDYTHKAGREEIMANAGTEFISQYSIEQIQRGRYFSFMWYDSGNFCHYASYWMAKIDGKWIVAGSQIN